MNKQSAGILLYRLHDRGWQFFLVHMGGPFWAKKDEGAWSIPKGEFSDEEDALTAAKREFREETGMAVEGKFESLSPIRQSGKKIFAWAVEGDCDASTVQSNMFELEWPPKSGKMEWFPEVDKANWFSFEQAKAKIVKGQQPLLEELNAMLIKK